MHAVQTFSGGGDFDVFISYRRRDRQWVEETLLPRLRAWGVVYCVDFEAFSKEAPFEQEMNRFLAISRTTLVVLSGHWLASPFTNFEADASTGRVIVVRLDESPLPPFPSGSKVVDLTRVSAEREWTALKFAINEAKVESLGLVQPSIEMAFRRGAPAAGTQGKLSPQYEVDLVIENRSAKELAFDNLLFEAPRPPPGGSTWWAVDRAYLAFEGERAFVRSGTMNRFSDPGGELVRLSPGHGMEIPAFPLAGVAVSEAGRSVVELSVTLALGHAVVSESCVCPLPPVTRIPAAPWRKGPGREGGFRLLPAGDLPVPSGIADASVRGRVLHTARSYAADALLKSVAPWAVSLTGTEDYGALYSAFDWHCTFSSESADCTFAIPLGDPGWIGEENVAKGHLQEKQWLSELHLERCRVESRLAFLIGLAAGCRPPSWLSAAQLGCPTKPLERLSLVMKEVEEKWRCLWMLPLCLEEDVPAAVTADTGEVCRLEGDRWSLLRDSIWNQQAHTRRRDEA